MSWDQFYNLLGIKDFIYFISSPQIQDMLFPVKLVFIAFAAFFFMAVVYFMLNSSWLNYKFLEDVTEFFSWQAYGSRHIVKRWQKIKKRLDSASESEYKLAVLEADDYLGEVLDERGFEGKNFEEIIQKAGKLIAQPSEILSAHEVRNLIVYNPDYKLGAEEAKKNVGIYETAVNGIGIS